MRLHLPYHGVYEANFTNLGSSSCMDHFPVAPPALGKMLWASIRFTWNSKKLKLTRITVFRTAHISLLLEAHSVSIVQGTVCVRHCCNNKRGRTGLLRPPAWPFTCMRLTPTHAPTRPTIAKGMPTTKMHRARQGVHFIGCPQRSICWAGRTSFGFCLT